MRTRNNEHILLDGSCITMPPMKRRRRWHVRPSDDFKILLPLGNHDNLNVNEIKGRNQLLKVNEDFSLEMNIPQHVTYSEQFENQRHDSSEMEAFGFDEEEKCEIISSLGQDTIGGSLTPDFSKSIIDWRKILRKFLKQEWMLPMLLMVIILQDGIEHVVVDFLLFSDDFKSNISRKGSCEGLYFAPKSTFGG